jgi:hypothetical protein
MQTGEPNWAEVDGEAAMDYGTLPGLLPDLGPKVGVEEDPALDALDALDLDIDTSNPAVRNFLNNLPSTGPYRIMVTNLPTNITKESLESELSTTYKITATIDYKSSDHYCFLKFTNRSHCLESTSLFGARIHGAAVKLKVRPSDQQAEIRRANTARNNSTRGTLSGSTGGRFKNLTRDGTSSRETKKHRAPVGGSIRKKRSNRNNQSSSHSKPPTNPWNSESRTQPKKEKPESDYKILPRGKQPTTNANSRFSRTSGASAAPARGNRDEMRAAPRQNRDFGRRNDRDFGRRNDRDDRRNNDRDDRRNNDRNNDRDRGGDRDDAFDFRNRRKLREEDGRSDDALNWRRGGSSSNAPARSRMDRRDPGRATDGAESNFSRRAMNSSSTQNRKSQVQKDKEKEADRAKNRFQNKFALLEEDDD